MTRTPITSTSLAADSTARPIALVVEQMKRSSAPATLVGAFQDFTRTSPALVRVVTFLFYTSESESARLIAAVAAFDDIQAPCELFRLYEDDSSWSDDESAALGVL